MSDGVCERARARREVGGGLLSGASRLEYLRQDMRLVKDVCST